MNIKWRLLKLMSPEGGDVPPAGDDKDKQKAPNPDGKDDPTKLELARQVKDLKDKNEALTKKNSELEGENKDLYENFINGGDGVDGKDHNGGSASSAEAVKKELDAEIQEVLGIGSAGMSNIEYAKHALRIRKKMMELGQPDPFLPKGHDFKPDESDKQKAQNVADVFEECIEAANGDNALFTATLQSKIAEDSPLMKNFMAKMKAQRIAAKK